VRGNGDLKKKRLGLNRGGRGGRAEDRTKARTPKKSDFDGADTRKSRFIGDDGERNAASKPGRESEVTHVGKDEGGTYLKVHLARGWASGRSDWRLNNSEEKRTREKTSHLGEKRGQGGSRQSMRM